MTNQIHATPLNHCWTAGESAANVMPYRRKSIHERIQEVAPQIAEALDPYAYWTDEIHAAWMAGATVQIRTSLLGDWTDMTPYKDLMAGQREGADHWRYRAKRAYADYRIKPAEQAEPTLEQIVDKWKAGGVLQSKFPGQDWLNCIGYGQYAETKGQVAIMAAMKEWLIAWPGSAYRIKP